MVGLLPYLTVDIDDEDSLSSRLENRKGRLAKEENKADIAVIRFPRISNFTDLSVFSAQSGGQVRYVEQPGDLGTPDLVILPGTKNNIGDLLWMRQNGLEGGILQLAHRGTPLWGICGGYQMLGEELSDPEGVEGEPGRRIQGMGLLDVYKRQGLPFPEKRLSRS